jgi:predicted transcriptional regulator
MNFNVYLEDALARRLTVTAKRTGVRRNALIRQAVADWVTRTGASWPAAVLGWMGDPAMRPFEASRAELAKMDDDPLSSAKARPSKEVRVRGGHARRR